MTTITERIVLLNQQLELFKSSIDVLIQQNNENVNAIKKWENKQFTLVREEGETVDQLRERGQEMLGELEDIWRRNGVTRQNIEEFTTKMISLLGSVNALTNEYGEQNRLYENQCHGIQKEIGEHQSKDLQEALRKNQEVMDEAEKCLRKYNLFGSFDESSLEDFNRILSEKESK